MLAGDSTSFWVFFVCKSWILIKWAKQELNQSKVCRKDAATLANISTWITFTLGNLNIFKNYQYKVYALKVEQMKLLHAIAIALEYWFSL